MELKDLTSAYTLANGIAIPVVGYGTFRTPATVARQAVKTAIEVGYRHIDTAAVYENEEAVGQGIKDSGIDRDSIFLTSKLWNTERGYDKTIAAFEASLKRLQTTYLDLYLIHWPANQKQFGDQAAALNAETWRALEDLYKQRKVKAIGLSNFMPHHVAELLKTAKIRPQVDQIEVHPGWTHQEEIKKLQAMGILVEAWAPLGGQGATVMENETIKQIATAHGKTPAQVVLRWEIQQEVLPLPKSVHEHRMKENADVFDFTLSPAEMGQIAALPNMGGQCADPDEVDY